MDAVRSEMKDLLDLKCFKIMVIGYKYNSVYQETTLKILFAIKQDLRRAARLVTGGHLVNAMNHNVYSLTIKDISMKLLHVVSHK